MLYRNIHPILYQEEVAPQWDEDIDNRIKHVFKSGLDRGQITWVTDLNCVSDFAWAETFTGHLEFEIIQVVQRLGQQAFD